jgi:hypothetical protein
MSNDNTHEPIESHAYHEAGHAVAGYLTKNRFTKVSIIPDDDSEGRCDVMKWTSTLDPASDSGMRLRYLLEKRVITLCGGPVAEELFTGCWPEIGSSADMSHAIDLLDHLSSGPRETEAYLAWLLERTKSILSVPFNWVMVQDLASELIIAKELGERRARAIIKNAKQKWIDDRKLTWHTPGGGCTTAV